MGGEGAVRQRCERTGFLFERIAPRIFFGLPFPALPRRATVPQHEFGGRGAPLHGVRVTDAISEGEKPVRTPVRAYYWRTRVPRSPGACAVTVEGGLHLPHS